MIINDLDDYYIVFDTKNRNTELDTLVNLLTNKIQNKNPARKYVILADFTMF